MPDGYCPPVRPDLHEFLGYRDERTLFLERPEAPGHFVDSVHAALVKAGYTPRTQYTRFEGPYRARGPIVLSPYTAVPFKDWPRRSWDALYATLTDAGYVCEWETTGTLWELERQLRNASLVVGADSGPLHLADYMGIPVLGLYSITRPSYHGPLGGNARVIYNPDGTSMITVAQVFEQIQHMRVVAAA